MYHFSRSIYRELAPAVRGDKWDPAGEQSRRALLASCEAVVRRLAREPHFARPTRALFQEIRFHFAPKDQPWVLGVVERHTRTCREHLERLPDEERFGQRPCDAVTRNGEACQRTAVKGRTYCPSHRHLEEVGVPG